MNWINEFSSHKGHRYLSHVSHTWCWFHHQKKNNNTLEVQQTSNTSLFLQGAVNRGLNILFSGHLKGFLFGFSHLKIGSSKQWCNTLLYEDETYFMYATIAIGSVKIEIHSVDQNTWLPDYKIFCCDLWHSHLIRLGNHGLNRSRWSTVLCATGISKGGKKATHSCVTTQLW